MNTILVKTKFMLPTLPKAERRVAEYLLNNAESIRGMTLLILAAEAGASDTSVIRFCRRLGYEGFADFKRDFMTVSVDENETVTEGVNPGDSVLEIYKKVCQHNTETLTNTQALFSSESEDALNALLKAESIHFFGVGDAWFMAQWAAIKFMRLGFTTSAHADVDLQLVTASRLGKNDVAFAISYSGATNTVVNAIKTAKEAGATTVCITQMNKSPLLKYIDIKLFISVADMTVGRDIVGRRVADQAILEALYLGVLTKSDREKYVKKTQKAIDINKI